MRTKQSLSTDNQLTPGQYAFLDALLVSPTHSFVDAYRRAFFCPDLPAQKAAARGWQMAHHPAVQAEFQRRRASIEQAVDAQAIQLETALARIAFADIRQLVDPETGMERPLHELPDDLAAAISGVEAEHYVRGKGEDIEHGVRRKYKFADRHQAISTLLRRRGMAKDDTTGSIAIKFELNL